MGRVDADAIDDLGADAAHGAGEVVLLGGGQHARRDGDAAEVGHLVGADGDGGAAGVGARGRAQHQVERVLGVDGEAADLGAVHLEGPGDVPGLLAVPVQRQRDQVGGRELDGVPLQHHGRLRRVAAPQGGRRRLRRPERAEDPVLQRRELLVRLGLGVVVARYRDVDDGAGGDVGREEDGGEFDLGRVIC